MISPANLERVRQYLLRNRAEHAAGRAQLIEFVGVRPNGEISIIKYRQVQDQ